MIGTIYEFDPVIYPYKLWIVIDKTTKMIPDIFKEYNGKDIVFDDSEVDMMRAFAMTTIHKEQNKYGALLYFKSKKSMTMGLVAHEATHAAKYLFEHINADITEHEPFEYVVGWIAKCCGEVKTKKNASI